MFIRTVSVLSVVGIAIGVAAVVVLTSLGEAAREDIVDEFVGLGTNVIAVVPGKVETSGAMGVFGGTTHDLTIDDAQAVQRRCTAVRRAAPVSLGEAPLQFGAAGRQIPVIGTTPDYLEIRDFTVSSGQSLPGGDPHRGERVCLIGRTVQEKVFGHTSPLGEAVRLGDWRFRVIGVLGAKGKMMGVDMDDVVLVPVRTAMRMFDRTSLFRILLQARSPVDVEMLLQKQRTAFDDAWKRFEERHPRKVRSVRHRIERVAASARLREAARSEATRVIWVIREFVLRVGELAGLEKEDDVFFLSLEHK